MTALKPIKLVADDVITDGDFEAMAKWLKDKPRLSQGPEVATFEHEWAEWLGVRHAVFVNSGSSANLLAYAALLTRGRGRDWLVAAPAIAWPTTISPIIQYGLPVVLIDGDASWGMDPSGLERLCLQTPPSIVIVVDVLGVPADWDRLLALKDRYGFALIADDCGAHGSLWRGKKCGSFTDLSTFSFFVGHAMTTIEGGMVCTNDDSLNRQLRMLRAHGWTSDLDEVDREAILNSQSHRDPFRDKFTFFTTGMNLRNTELAAFLGRRQLRRLDAAVAARAVNYQLYAAKLTGRKGLFYPCAAHGVPSSIGFGFGTNERDAVSKRLTAAGVEHRAVGGGDMGRQPFMRNYARFLNPEEVRVTARLVHDAAIQVPCHPGLTEQDIDRVCAAILGTE